MSTSSVSNSKASETETIQKSPRMFNLVPVVIAWGVMLSIFVFYRTYQGLYGFKHGLDSTSPDFATYWMTLFQIEIPLIFGTGLTIWLYLWFSRDKNMGELKPEAELRRYFSLVGWFMVYTFSFLGIASIFGEGDAVWHQTVIRDTALTPSHIIVFYGFVPLFIVCGVSSLLFAVTRLPLYTKGHSVPLIMAVVGPALILPNLGFNEWGHAFWLTEEIFSHPLHWGFPILGWTGLALGGVLLQVVIRMSELMKQLGGPVLAVKVKAGV